MIKLRIGSFLTLCALCTICNAQFTPKIGAYYFDGWTGTYPSHITPLLKDSFANREPKWGWITSKQEIMDEQINLAADAGLSFFSFDWYYNRNSADQMKPMNNALQLYLNSPNKSKLQFCLLIANIGTSHIDINEWQDLTKEWLQLFKQKTYLTVNKKPLIIFLNLNYLLQRFGEADSLKNALSVFREEAKANGFDGLSIGLCVGLNNKKDIEDAKPFGFDVLTGYHNRNSGFVRNQTRVPIDNLVNGEKNAWNTLSSMSSLPYIPVCTLNWDPRPWANSSNNFSTAPYYVGFSGSSVYRSVSSLINWVNTNTEKTTKERIALLYAWNEYGEGAWLTPSKNDTLHLLGGVKRAIQQQ
jgi:hypothetical protein